MIGRWLLPLVLVTTTLAGCASPPTPTSPPALATRRFETGCGGNAAFADAARINAESLDRLDWSPFGAPEHGWRVYAPAIAFEIGTACAPDSGDFAAGLARWQAAHGLAADGRLTPAAFEPMKAIWQGRRPFLALRARGVCPDPPDEATLSAATDGDGVAGRTVLLAPEALRAFSRMRGAALADLGVERSAETLAVFSGYRSPGYDAARCAIEQNCQGVVRAQCSAHRTGLALDLVLGAAPGYAIDASDGPNRLYQTQTQAYRWLVANAARFGFVNYVFEPWHWEWTGTVATPPD